MKVGRALVVAAAICGGLAAFEAHGANSPTEGERHALVHALAFAEPFQVRIAHYYVERQRFPDAAELGAARFPGGGIEIAARGVIVIRFPQPGHVVAERVYLAPGPYAGAVGWWCVSPDIPGIESIEPGCRHDAEFSGSLADVDALAVRMPPAYLQGTRHRLPPEAADELAFAKRKPPQASADVFEWAHRLHSLAPALDDIFGAPREWPANVRVAAVLGRCAVQYPPSPNARSGPLGEGPSLLAAPACLHAHLDRDEEARRRAVEVARDALAELPNRFQRASTQYYDRSLYDFVTAGLVLTTIGAPRDGVPSADDAARLLALLADASKPVMPRLDLALGLLAAQWADASRVADEPFDRSVRIAFIQLALDEGGSADPMPLPAMKRERSQFVASLAGYPDVVETLRQAGAASAQHRAAWPDFWPQLVQPATLHKLGHLHVPYLRGFYEAKGDDPPSQDAGLRPLDHVPDEYRAELLHTVKGRYLYDEAVLYASWFRDAGPLMLRELFEAGYVPWHFDESRTPARLTFDAPAPPLPGAHVPRAPRRFPRLTFARFRRLQPGIADRILAQVSPDDHCEPPDDIHVERGNTRGIAFFTCYGSPLQLVGVRFGEGTVARLEGVEFSIARGLESRHVTAVYDADRDGRYEVQLEANGDAELLEEYEGRFRYFHADAPVVDR